MDSGNDRTGLLSDTRSRGSTRTPETPPQENPLYHDSSQSPTAKLMQLAFVAIVVVMVVITIILSIYRGATVSAMAGLYFMLGISLIGFVALEIIMILFLRRGDLPKEKTWFLYLVGACVLLEAIFTDVLLFQ